MNLLISNYITVCFLIEGVILMSSKELIGKVQNIESTKNEHSSNPALVEALNPFGDIKDMVADILNYQHQAKMLKVEQIRITEEAKIRHHQIDATLKVALKILEDRKKAIKNAFQIVSKELKQQHIERNEIIRSISNLNNGILDKANSLETKQLLQTALVEMSALLTNLGDQSTSKLALITENTSKALDAIPSTKGLRF